MMIQTIDLGRHGVITVPEMSASVADNLCTVIGDDRLTEIVNLTATQPITSVFDSWLNSLCAREFTQVRGLCLDNARHKGTGGKVSFSHRSDERKVMAGILYANLAPLCNYLNSEGIRV